jgi:hypothetical protein
MWNSAIKHPFVSRAPAMTEEECGNYHNNYFCVVVVGDIGARKQRQSFILLTLYDMNISNATKYHTRKRRPSSLSVEDTTIPKTTGPTDPPSQKERESTLMARWPLSPSLSAATHFFVWLFCQMVLFVFVFQSVEGRIRGKFLDGKTTATSTGTLTLGIGLDAKRAFHHTGFVINDTTLN